MDSRDEEEYMEMVFRRDISVSREEKVKALWRFLDAQDKLRPQRGTLEVETPSETTSSASCVDTAAEKDVWRKGLRVFQQLGLEKIARTTDNGCTFGLVERTIQCEGLPDTTIQPDEELNADVKALERRPENRRLSENEILASGKALSQCGSNDAEYD